MAEIGKSVAEEIKKQINGISDQVKALIKERLPDFVKQQIKEVLAKAGLSPETEANKTESEQQVAEVDEAAIEGADKSENKEALERVSERKIVEIGGTPAAEAADTAAAQVVQTEANAEIGML
jgi:hypothetical protein